MNRVKAKRSKRVTFEREIEIVSQRLVTPSLDANASGYLWIQLRRKCCVCGSLFKHGDSVSLCMYIEAGNQQSGGAHTDCLAVNDADAMLREREKGSNG